MLAQFMVGAPAPAPLAPANGGNEAADARVPAKEAG